MKTNDANTLRSERSKTKKPLRGAPPSSLSQPTPPDRSRSSSPSKPRTSPLSLTATLPSAKPLHSTSTSNRATVSIPMKGLISNDRNHEHRRITLPVNRGRSPLATGQVTSLKHPRFLPHPTNSTTTLSPSTSSFQLQFPSSTSGYNFYHKNKATAYGSLCISPQSL